MRKIALFAILVLLLSSVFALGASYVNTGATVGPPSETPTEPFLGLGSGLYCDVDENQQAKWLADSIHILREVDQHMKSAGWYPSSRVPVVDEQYANYLAISALDAAIANEVHDPFLYGLMTLTIAAYESGFRETISGDCFVWEEGKRRFCNTAEERAVAYNWKSCGMTQVRANDRNGPGYKHRKYSCRELKIARNAFDYTTTELVKYTERYGFFRIRHYAGAGKHAWYTEDRNLTVASMVIQLLRERDSCFDKYVRDTELYPESMTHWGKDKPKYWGTGL